MVTPQANEHHMSSRKWSFTIRWTVRFKIYKDLYSYPQDLWPVVGPSTLPVFQLNIT